MDYVAVAANMRRGKKKMERRERKGELMGRNTEECSQTECQANLSRSSIVMNTQI